VGTGRPPARAGGFLTFTRGVSQPYDAIVLAGGGGRRLGGADKAALVVGGRTLLDRVLDACAGARRVIVVGSVRPTSSEVLWCQEEPPGGGPVAAIAAGIHRTAAPLLSLLACDLPYLTAAAVAELFGAVREGGDGAAYVDGEGHLQPLVAVYRRESLERALNGLGAPYEGVALHRLVARLDIARLADPTGVARDCDTWDEVEVARRAERVGG
jgi:molybdopterin-guanine dinucleotide biosynthesis protein A